MRVHVRVRVRVRIRVSARACACACVRACVRACTPQQLDIPASSKFAKTTELERAGKVSARASGTGEREIGTGAREEWRSFQSPCSKPWMPKRSGGGCESPLSDSFD